MQAVDELELWMNRMNEAELWDIQCRQVRRESERRKKTAQGQVVGRDRVDKKDRQGIGRVLSAVDSVDKSFRGRHGRVIAVLVMDRAVGVLDHKAAVVARDRSTPVAAEMDHSTCAVVGVVVEKKDRSRLGVVELDHSTLEGPRQQDRAGSTAAAADGDRSIAAATDLVGTPSVGTQEDQTSDHKDTSLLPSAHQCAVNDLQGPSLACSVQGDGPLDR